METRGAGGGTGEPEKVDERGELEKDGGGRNVPDLREFTTELACACNGDIACAVRGERDRGVTVDRCKGGGSADEEAEEDGEGHP